MSMLFFAPILWLSACHGDAGAVPSSQDLNQISTGCSLGGDETVLLQVGKSVEHSRQRAKPEPTSSHFAEEGSEERGWHSLPPSSGAKLSLHRLPQQNDMYRAASDELLGEMASPAYVDFPARHQVQAPKGDELLNQKDASTGGSGLADMMKQHLGNARQHLNTARQSQGGIGDMMKQHLGNARQHLDTARQSQGGIGDMMKQHLGNARQHLETARQRASDSIPDEVKESARQSVQDMKDQAAMHMNNIKADAHSQMAQAHADMQNHVNNAMNDAAYHVQNHVNNAMDAAAYHAQNHMHNAIASATNPAQYGAMGPPP